jgi:hypothetical protein
MLNNSPLPKDVHIITPGIGQRDFADGETALHYLKWVFKSGRGTVI